MSLLERDRLIRDSWVSTKLSVPPEDPEGPHYSVAVWGIIDDPRYRMSREEGAFFDVVAYWPALKKFTVTHSCRADTDAMDVEVNVTYWQPIPPMPWST